MASERMGLVLTGGGARAAYQVGALRALAELHRDRPLPFEVVAGISAGAINGVVMACAANDFRAGAAALAQTWSSFTPDRIFRTGTLEMASIGSRWLRDLSGGGLLGGRAINYLLDSAPLRELIATRVPFARMRRHLRAGRLHGVAVSATSYATGLGITWYEGHASLRPWERTSRRGVPARLSIDHVMASAAIPVFFPPVRVGEQFYGDGCVRMIYPMSPAIHLGARRIVTISVRPAPGAATAPPPAATDGLALSQIAGVLLNAVFLDSLDVDLERLQRVNRTLGHLPPAALASPELDLHEIPVLALRPSVDLGALAADEYHRFPGMLRYFLKGLGATEDSGSDLLSYLAFEPVYVTRAMELGYTDTMERRDEVQAFLRGEITPPTRVAIPAPAG
jgi:NTE family protein